LILFRVQTSNTNALSPVQFSYQVQGREIPKAVGLPNGVIRRLRVVRSDGDSQPDAGTRSPNERRIGVNEYNYSLSVASMEGNVTDWREILRRVQP
jgi:hypothetical protein